MNYEANEEYLEFNGPEGIDAWNEMDNKAFEAIDYAEGAWLRDAETAPFYSN